MPEETGIGALYDAVNAELRDGVTLDLQHVSDHEGWHTGAMAAARLLQPQREAVEAAVDDGYYAMPRECTVAELSDRLGVPRSTLQYRLQRAEATLMERFVTHSS